MRLTALVGLLAAVLLLATGVGRATPTFTVTTTADTQDASPGDGVCADAGGACSLRAAVEEANALGGTASIDVPAGIYKTTIANPAAAFGTLPPGGANPTTGDIDVTATVSVVGAGASSTILDAGNLDREFWVHAGGTLTLNGVTVRHGFSGYDCDGGYAIHNAGTLQLTDATLTSNVANCGDGAAVDNAGTFGATGTTFAGNTMYNTSGGALYNTGTATVDSSTFSGNSSQDGGGIETSGSLALTNVTFSGNTAWFGGAVRVTGGSAVLKSDTLTGNTGHAIEADGGTAVLEDSILAANGTANCGTGGGTITSAGHNVDDGTTCALAGTGDQSSTDPLLVGLADNGGPVQTAALAFGSPAIGAGDSACPAADARGVSRGTCDVGAYQYTAPASLSVTRTDDPLGAGTCPLDCSLRQAVATTASGGTITLPAGAYVLTRGALTLSQNVTLSGAGAATTSISHSSLSANARVLYIPSGTVSLADVTIEHGDTVSGDGEPNGGVGGGMWIDSAATVSLSRVVVSSNTADTSGGGIDNDGALTIDRSVVSGNTASGASLEIGGGIDNWGTSLLITNTTIDGNHAGLQGGGLESGASSTLKNVTISNNVAGASGGGGVWGGASLVDTLLDGNTLVAGTAENCAGGVVSAGHNLSTDSSCPFTMPGDIAAAAAGAGVDAGDDAQCTAVDQNGTSRPQGPHCDIGALETTNATSSGGGGGTATPGSPPPAAPVARFAVAPAAPVAGAAVSFDGSASTGASSYAWSFGDGTTAGGAVASHAFSTPGIYAVGLTVTAADGASASSSQVVVVSSAPSAATDTQIFAIDVSPSHPLASVPVTFRATPLGRAPRTFTWWRDGQRVCASPALCVWSSPSAGSTTVRVEEVDGDGRHYTAQQHVRVWPLTNPEAQLSTIEVERLPRPPGAAQSQVGAWEASVVLRDQNGLIHGHQVKLSFSGSHASATQLSSVAPGGGTRFDLHDGLAEQVTVTAEDQTTGIVLDAKPLVSFSAAPSQSLSTVTADATQTVADGAASITATVKLVDSLGRPVPGEQVSLEPMAGSPRGTRSTTARVAAVADGTTDAAGTAQFTVTDTVAEALALEAQVPLDGVTVQHTAQVKFVTAASLQASGSTSAVTAPPAIATGGSGIATVTVRDGLGDPLAGRAVTVHAGPSVLVSPATAVTDAGGQASFTVSDRTAEHVQLAATDVTDEVDVASPAPVLFYAPGASSATSTLSLVATATAPADGRTALTALVRLRDAGGFAVPGVHVGLDAGGSAQVDPANAVTDANGDVRFAVTDAAVEEVTLRANVDAQGVSLSPVAASFVRLTAVVTAVQRSAGPSVQHAATSPSGPGWFEVGLRIMDGSGPARNRQIALEPPSGAAVTVRDALGTGPGTTSTTGNVDFFVDAPSAGAVTFRIHDLTDQLVLGTVDVPFTGRPDPATSTVVVAPATVADDGVSYATITATLLDQGKSPVPGETVVAVARSRTTAQITSAVTDANGVAVLKARDSAAETVTVDVSAREDGVQLGSRTLHFVPASQTGVSASLSTVVPDGDTPADGVTPAHVFVTLKDGGGVGRPGKTVTLHADGGSSTISPESAVTDANGRAAFSVTDAALEQVTYSAVDVTDGLPIAQTAPVFFFDPLAVSAATSSVAAAPPAVDADGKTPATVTVTLRNRGGAPLPGQPVALSGNGTGTTISPGAATTDALGVATFSVVDSAQERVTLTATDTLQPELVLPTAVVAFGAPEPPTVTIDAPSGTPRVLDRVAFDTTVSDPSGAAIVSYAWSFGDGTTSGDRAPWHGFARAGTYTVTVHVTDARGATGSATRVVTVAAGTNGVSAPAYAPVGMAGGATIELTGPQMQSVTIAATGGSSQAVTVDHSGTATARPLPLTVSAAQGRPPAAQVFDDVPETVDYVVTSNSSSSVRADVAITYVRPAVAAESSLSLSKHAAKADHADTVLAHVQLRDQAGKPAPNNVVKLSASRVGGGLARVAVQPAEAVTDAHGVATFSLVDATGESVYVHATDVTTATNLGPTSASPSAVLDAATVTFAQVLPASASASTVTVGSSVVHTFAPGTTVAVRLVNKYGGVEVGKQLSLAATGSATVSPASAVTDSSGTASFRVVDGSAETVTLKAVDGTDSVTLLQKPTVRFADHTVDPAASTVSAAQGAAPAGADAGVQVTVTLKDGTGAPVGATTVHLHPSSSHSTVSDASVRTDVSGRATFTVTDPVQETVTYTATAEVGTSTIVTIAQRGSVQWTTPVVSAVASSLDPPTLTAPYFQNPSFSVLVRDGANDPLAGRTVRAVFVYADSGQDYPVGAVTLSPAGQDVADAHNFTVHTGQSTTDAGGVATFTFSSNNSQGGAFPRWFKVDVQVAKPDGSWLDLGTVSLDYEFEFQH